MGLLRTASRVAVASSVHGKVQRRQRAKWSAQTEVPPQAAAPVVAPIADPGPAPAPASSGDMGAKLEQLTQLGQLRDAGVLTAEEFDAKKALILAS